LIFAAGADPGKCLMVDSKGILHRDRADLEAQKEVFEDKWRLCQSTNDEQRRGGIPEALKSADVVIALSKPGPDTVRKEWIATMAEDAIVFACANPIPEIWPWEAKEAGAAVVATGRSDFPNQVNNSLGFPAIFRGTLDVRASTITDEMCFAAAAELAAMAAERGLTTEHILPTMDEWELFPREATAVAMKAIEQGIAGKMMTYEEEFNHASKIIRRSRDITETLMNGEFIERTD
jgi:malate dehydrogenase (oxaloacetate-decarboxylating)